MVVVLYIERNLVYSIVSTVCARDHEDARYRPTTLVVIRSQGMRADSMPSTDSPCNGWSHKVFSLLLVVTASLACKCYSMCDKMAGRVWKTPSVRLMVL